MKILLLILFGSSIGLIDQCQEYRTYEECIGSTQIYCLWDYLFEICSQSENYLIGCNPYINKIGCVKQLGYGIQQLALCKFGNYCTDIKNFESEQCSNNMNKYGCLSIRTKNSICKWENENCHLVTGQDIDRIQSTFHLIPYSVNACQLIKHYLIIHHTLLWKMSEYQPDLLEESNQQILNQTTQEHQDLSLLINNYGENNHFNWFQGENTKYSITNRTRLGCNAVDIQDFDDFKTLITHEYDTYGVNHVYCKYLEQIVSYIIYQGGRCVQVDPQIMAYTEYVDENNVQCEDLSYQFCSTYHSKKRKCYIPDDYEIEFTCQQGEKQVDLILECFQSEFYPYYICQHFDYCYFDTKRQSCSQSCFNIKEKESCIDSGVCKWQGQNDGQTNNYMNCVPINGCNTLGLDQLSCKFMLDDCDWQDNKCIELTDSQTLTCEQAYNQYVCLNILKSDQQCLWYQDTCLNFIDYDNTYLYFTLPSSYLMNRNLCIQFKNDLFIYDPISYQCVYQSSVQINCNNYYINKYHCFNIVNDLCQWDDYTNQCTQITNITYCNNLMNVSYRVCTQAKLQNAASKCEYDWNTNSCFETKSLIDMIQTESDCYLMNQQYQYRQWKLGKCIELTVYHINQLQCISWKNVNRNVCVINTFNNAPCIYDEQFKLCYNDVIIYDCSINYNRFACQQSQGKCYYDEINDICKGIDKTVLLELHCDTNFLSKTACLSIETQQMKCMWDPYFQECRINDQPFQYCNQFSMNKYSCITQKALVSNQYHQYHYCQFDSTSLTCTINNDSITGCGINTSLSINYHRCINYTSNLCMFSYNQCVEIAATPNRIEIQYLNEMTCDLANQQLCAQITNPSQGCRFYKFIQFDYIDARCVNIDFNKFTCANLATIASPYINQNKAICSKATDACIYGTTTCKVISSTSTNLYSCSTIGLSLLACTGFTVGKCIFYQDQCQYQTDNIVSACSQRNQQACTSSTLIKCAYNSTLKQCISTMQDCSTRIDSTFTYSWSTCSTSSQNCYGFKNKCIAGFIDNVPCDMPGLSQSVCKSQSNLYCEFFNGYCQFQVTRACNEIIDKEECVRNKLSGQYCVFHNSACFNVVDINLWTCSSFDYTSHHFCKRFPDCSYDFKLYKCSANQPSQYSLNCLESNAPNQFLKLNENNECISVLQQQYSTCEEIQKIKINYNLCQHISDLNGNNCQYDFQTNLCKLTYIQVPSSCDTITNEIQCMFVQLVCYVNYTNSVFTTCSASSTTGKLNRFGCNSRTDKSSIFSYDDWSCIDGISSLNDHLKLVNSAHQLNEKGCYDFSSSYGISLFTIWKNNKCVRITQKQAMNLTSCKGLNKNACTSVSQVACYWDKVNIICQTDTTLNYNVNCEAQIVTNTNYTYSQALCSKINIVGQRCIQKSTMQGCEQLSTTDSKSVSKCILMGLNREACLLETKQAYCFWNNGSCDDANLLIQKCEEDVSQLTCANIQNYLCQWKNNKCVTFQPDYTLCENQNGYQQYCLNNLQLQCKYIPKLSQCKNFLYTPMNCDNYQSKYACKNVVNTTCQWLNNQCQDLLVVNECASIYNEESCLLNQQFSCIWDNDLGCQTFYLNNLQNYYNLPPFLNKKGCLTYSIEETNYENFQCTNILSYEQIKDKTTIVLGEIIKIQCQFQLNKLNCIATHTQNQFCIWGNNKCQSIKDEEFNNLMCQSDVNIWGCLAITTINQNCKWSGQKCMDYRQDDKLMINVNVNVCINFTENQIYYNNSCVSRIDIPCDSQGISRLTCLNNQNYACQHNGINCIYFVNRYNQCNQIVQVSKKACSSVGDELKCQFQSDYSCTQFTDLNLLEGISKKACLSKNGFYYWKSGQCTVLDFIPICDEGQEVTSDSCALVEDSLCLYSSKRGTCVSDHNQYLLTCSTPGLNKIGCFSVVNEPCIFQQNKCQLFLNQYESYAILNNVNSLVCRRLIYGDIEYNEIEHKCTYLITKTQCNGLNIEACNKISYCNWNQDKFQCGCYKSTTICQSLQTRQSCEEIQQCIYWNQECKLKLCQHLTQLECAGQQLDQYCYLNQYNKCSQAKSCEDIIDSTQCESIYINGYPCIQKINTSRCFSNDNYQLICQQSTECNHSKCIYENNQCRMRNCSDTKKSESCNQFSNCAFINQQCLQIDSCFQVTDSSQCNQVVVNGQKCNWQQQNLADKTEICTSNPCQLLSASKLLCHGNEVNNYSCILRNLKCVQCEFISESCECNSYINICSYKNGKCQSMLCQDYLTKDECSTQKCEWSTLLNRCELKCYQKYNELICNERSGECHWNQSIQQCEIGPQTIAIQHNFEKVEQKYKEIQQIFMILIILIY